MFRTSILLGAALWIAAAAAPSRGDVYTYRDEGGKERTVAARLVGEGQQNFVLEADDGEWMIVPSNAVKSRVPGEDPKPVSPQEVARRLEARFTNELFRSRIDGNNVIGFVLMGPLDGGSDARLKAFFDRAAQFTQQVDRVFARFCQSMKLDTEEPKHPQVMLIFEHDDDFDKYAKSVMTAETLSVQRVAGFYSLLSNWLVVRMDECDSFAVPLHEAIHQRTYNRGLLQRLAPVPAWFCEGIATGFENSGSTVNTDPTKINRNYASRSLGPLGVSFSEVLKNDASFHGDVLASDAYTRDWALHWLLVTDRPKQYADYLRKLSRLKPLDLQEKEERLAEFQSTFNLDPAALDGVYQQKLAAESRRQNMKIQARQAVGNIVTQDQGGMVEIGLVRREDLGGRLATSGKIKNMNPVRTLTFRVSLIPPAPAPTIAWFVPDLGAGKTIPLDRQVLANPGEKFTVEIRCALPSSETCLKWKSQSGVLMNKGKPR